MLFFLRSLALILILLSFNLRADDANLAPCGMMYDVNGILKVESMNGDICENDIAFQVLYILYADIFENPIWKTTITPFLHQDAKDSEFISFASNTLGISGFVSGLMDIMAALGWTILAPLLIWKGQKIYVLYASKKTGDEESNNINKPKLMAYFGFLIILALPVGGMMLGQGVSIIASMPSLYVSNQLLSSYLAGTQIAETDVVVDQEILEMQGQSFATGLISMQLCQSRTSKALFETNAKPGSSFFDPIGLNSFYTLDQAFTNREVNACLSYHFNGVHDGVLSGQTNAVKSIKLAKGSSYLGLCPGAGLKIYDEEVHGFEHLCGDINYSYPGSTEELDNWGIEDNLMAIQEDFNPSKFFGQFKNKELKLKMLMFDSVRDLAVTRKEISDLFITLADEVIAPRIRGSNLFNEVDREKLLVQYMYALNSMLGGSILNDAEWEINNTAVQYIIPGLNDDDEGRRYGAEYLTEYALKISDLMEEHHCAVNWKDYSELRKRIVDYNNADVEGVKVFLSGFEQSDCIRFVNFDANGLAEPSSQDERSRYIGYQTKHNLNEVFADIAQDGSIKSMTPQEAKAQMTLLIDLVANDRYEQALIKKMVLEGYYTAVKRAFIDVLSERLLDEVGSDDMYIVARQKGAAALGALMMNITQNQAGGVYFKSLIQETGTVTAYADEEYYINTDAFGDDAEEQIKDLYKSFTPFNTETFFSMGHTALLTPSESQYIDEDEEMFTVFLMSVENLLLEPMIHVKKASGIPSDMLFIAGLEDCMNGDSSRCISGASHPMVAMSRFGHHLADNMIQLLLINFFAQTINDMFGIVSFKGEPKENSVQKKAVKMGTKLLKLGALPLTGSISMIAFVLGILEPIFMVLFAMGMFFAYILPVLGFLYSMSMIVLWVLALGLGSIALPFYIIIKIWTIESSHQDGFTDFYQTFLNPYVKLLFITVAIVLSYIFMSISLFATNSTFSMLFSGMDSLATSSVAGFSISKLIFKMLLYIAYFVSLFVLITLSIKMIKSVPDMLAKKMRLNGTNDDSFVDSMKFESYVQASIVQQLSKLPEGVTQGMKGRINKSNQEQEIAKNMDAINEFLAKTSKPKEQKNANENSAVKSDRGASETDNVDDGSGADESSPSDPKN